MKQLAALILALADASPSLSQIFNQYVQTIVYGE